MIYPTHCKQSTHWRKVTEQKHTKAEQDSRAVSAKFLVYLVSRLSTVLSSEENTTFREVVLLPSECFKGGEQERRQIFLQVEANCLHVN